MTYDQAQAQVTARVKESLGVFPSGGTLKRLGPGIELPCSDSDGAPDTTPVSIQPGFWIEGIGTAGNRKYLSDFVSYWTAKGWQLSLDGRPKIQSVGMTSKDGFEVVMQLTFDGARASVTGGSPCVRPKPAPRSSG